MSTSFQPIRSRDFSVHDLDLTYTTGPRSNEYMTMGSRYTSFNMMIIVTFVIPRYSQMICALPRLDRYNGSSLNVNMPTKSQHYFICDGSSKVCRICHNLRYICSHNVYGFASTCRIGQDER